MGVTVLPPAAAAAAAGPAIAAVTYGWAMDVASLDGAWSYEHFRAQLAQYMGHAPPAPGDAPTYAFFQPA